ncbi:MAG: response regulator [Elusimicrobia bacterium]|nr:response regulator [Elusimicrobiota bacterium]
MTTDDPAPGEQSLLKQSPNFRGSIPRNASQRQLQEAVSQALGPGPRLGPPPGSDAGAPAPIRYKALITDDERSFIQFVDMALHRGDVEFHRASDGREALDLARSLKPDVIVSDVMMPGLTGVELMRELAKDPRLKDIPCILVTSTRMNPKQVELLLRDLPSVRYVLPKPCSIGALQSAFKALLKPKGPVST